MSHRHHRHKKTTATARDSNDGAEILLRAEVAFWREMIDSCMADHPPTSLERMRQALALAEYRLMRCRGVDPGPAAPTGGAGETGGPGCRSLH